MPSVTYSRLLFGLGGTFAVGFLGGWMYCATLGEYRSAHSIAHLVGEIANYEEALGRERERRKAAQARLAEIDATLAECKTIRLQRGADGVLNVAVIRIDGSGYEVAGRTLEELVP